MDKEEFEKKKEQQAMENLKRSAIQKSRKSRYPMSINKAINLFGRIYENRFSRQILLLVEASVRNPPPRLQRIGL